MMPINLLVGGAAGQGIETTSGILENLLQKAGYYVLTCRDFMSRVRGGHNFSLIRIGPDPITSHNYNLNILVALNQESWDLHQHQLAADGIGLADESLQTDDARVIKIGWQQIAKDLGFPPAAGSVVIGALLGLLKLDLQHLEAVLTAVVGENHLAENLAAIKAGHEKVKPHFDIQPGHAGDLQIISGNQAIALGALAAGLRFYTAYPMSPSTSILEFLAHKSQEADIIVEQAEDEIAAVNMAIGASFAGARAMTGTSGGGFSLMVEGLGLTGMAEIPLVIVNAQRPGPATGLPTRTEQSDLKFVISASQGEFPRLIIALRDQQDAYDQTFRAFDIAERYRIPVILLTDQFLADATTTISPFQIPDKASPVAPESALPAEDYRYYQLTEDGLSPRVLPGHPRYFATADSDEHDECGKITESAEVRVQMVDKRMRKLKKLEQELIEPAYFGSEDCETLLIGWGSLQGSLCEAITALNEASQTRYGALVFGDIYPLPTSRCAELAGAAKRIINVEQNATGQLAGLLREYAGITCHASLLKYDGRQMSGEEIIAWLQKEGY